MEIVLTAFLIASLIMLFSTMRQAGYNIILFVFENILIFVPIPYVAWVYKITYTHQENFSKGSSYPRLLYLTSITPPLVNYLCSQLI